MKVSLLLIILFAGLLRFIYLDRIPPGLAQDETSIGYNAYSILKTGKDEYGKTLPIFFKAFGEYKLPVYIYLSVPSIYIFGLTEYGVRIPSALFGTITVVSLYLFLTELFPDRKYTPSILFSVLLLAVNPWHIFFSRAAFEVTPALFFLVIGGFLWLKGSRINSLSLRILSLLCFGLSGYTYNLCRLLAPLLLIGLFEYCRRVGYRFPTKGNVVIFAGIIFLFILPYLTTRVSTNGLSGTFLFTSLATRSESQELRSYVWLSSPWIARLMTPLPVFLIWKYIQNIFLYISGSYFFAKGPQHPNHTTGVSGLFFPFEIVTILVGILLVKRYTKQWYILLYWTGITILLAAATRESPYATRSFFILPPLVTFSGFGIAYILTWLRHQKGFIKNIVVVGGGCAIYISIISVWIAYVYRFPIVYAKNWRYKEKDVAVYLQKHINDYDEIVIDPKADIKYTSLLYYLSYPPDIFQSIGKRAPDSREGFSEVLTIGNISFRTIDWKTDILQKNTLLITSPIGNPKLFPATTIWYYPKRPVVLVDNEELKTSFINEEAFLAFDTNGK